MKKFIAIIIMSFILPFIAMADVSVTIKLDRYEIPIVDSVKLVVSVSGSRDADTPKINGLNNFNARQGGTSSQMQIINGQVNSSLNFTFYLQPKHHGIFKIGPAVIRVDGKEYSSNSAKLTVKKSINKKGIINQPVFLTATLSSNNVYVEEQLQYTISLYHIPKVSNLSLSLPETEGINFKELSKPVEYNTVHNSTNYQVVEVKYSVIPSKTGIINIDPAKMTMVIHTSRKRGRQGIDDFFSMNDFFSSARGKQVTLASKPITLRVMSAPEKGKPSDYTGLVGSFKISSKLEPRKIKAGESATLTVILRGSGNTQRMPDLIIPEISDAKIYADEPTIETQDSQKGAEGIKTMKWAIVPETEGKYEIPSLSICFFDTKLHIYRRIKSNPLMLSVTPSSGKVAMSPFTKNKPPLDGKEAIEELGSDILPIHRSIKGVSSLYSGAIRWPFWLLLLIPTFVYWAIIVRFKITKKTPQKETQLKALRAANNFSKSVKDNKASADTLSESSRVYINHRFNLELGSLTPDDIANLLIEKGTSEKTANRMKSNLKKIESIIYTGKGHKECNLSEEAEKIIRQIEKEIK